MTRNIARAAQRTALILLGVVAAGMALEIGMRVVGCYLSAQEERLGEGFGAPRGRFCILCLGESTTAPRLEATDWDFSWPAQLEKILVRRYPGLRISVVNKGVSGTNSAVLTARLPSYLDRYRPQAVVAMMGINDDKWYGVVKKRADAYGRIYDWFYGLRTIKLIRWLWHEGLPSFSKMRVHGPGNRPVDPELASCQRMLRHSFPRNFKKLEVVCSAAAARNPADARAFVALAEIYDEWGKWGLEKVATEKALALDSGDPWMLIRSAWDNFSEGKYGESERRLREAAALETVEGGGAGSDLRERELATIYMMERYVSAARHGGRVWDSGELRGAFSRLLAADPDYQPRSLEIVSAPALAASWSSPTAQNYREMQRLLKGRGIPFFVMQYPLRDVSQLRAFFPEGSDVAFIDNKKAFQAALARGSYDAIFRDHFAGDFGHCTPAGNRLIALNVAAALKKVIRQAIRPRPST